MSATDEGGGDVTVTLRDGLVEMKRCCRECGGKANKLNCTWQVRNLRY